MQIRSRIEAMMKTATVVHAAFALVWLCAWSTHSAAAKAAAPGAAAGSQRRYERQEPFVTRPFRLVIGKRWIGNAIAYGPHRDGQRPDGASPRREELRQEIGRAHV